MIPQEQLLITVMRPHDLDQDSYVKSDHDKVYTGVRAAMRRPSGLLMVQGGQQEDMAIHMICDPIDLQYTDQIVDEDNGDTYEVAWCTTRHIATLSAGMSTTAFDYTEAVLHLVKGDRAA